MGTFGAEIGQFNEPADIAFDPNSGDVFVSDLISSKGKNMKINNRTYDPRLTALNNIGEGGREFLSLIVQFLIEWNNQFFLRFYLM